MAFAIRPDLASWRSMRCVTTFVVLSAVACLTRGCGSETSGENTATGSSGAGGDASSTGGAAGSRGTVTDAGGAGCSVDASAAMDAGDSVYSDVAIEGSGQRDGGVSRVPDLKILTFNIRYGTAADGANAWPNRRELVYRVLREQDADSAGLQEALIGQLQDVAAALPQYQRIGVGRDDGVTAGEFSAILFRASRFEVASSGTFWFSDTPEVPGSTSWGNTTTRICTWGRFVEKQTGRSYYHFNVHLDNVSQPSREKSVQLLMKRVAERPIATDPFIVTGDFNAGESEPAVRYMVGAASIGGTANPIPLVDSFRQVYPTATNVGTFNNFQGITTGDKIDFIFMGPNEKATAAEIVHTQENGRYPSDHFAVAAAIDMLGWN